MFVYNGDDEALTAEKTINKILRYLRRQRHIQRGLELTTLALKGAKTTVLTMESNVNYVVYRQCNLGKMPAIAFKVFFLRIGLWHTLSYPLRGGLFFLS